MRISWRKAMLRRPILSSFIAVAIATTFCNAQLEETNIEIKTEAPPAPQPSPSQSSQEGLQDCNEYLYGKLHGIRHHGTTWQNSASDCSNCTCDNGDIRCFFHFCNGPPTGYMTPPSSVKEAFSFSSSELSKGDNPSHFSNHIEDLEESSGFFPPQEDQDAEGDEALWPLPSEDFLWPTEVPSDHTPPTDESNALPPLERRDNDILEDATLTLFYDSPKEKFCGKSCKKFCPKGFKVDRTTGCWKCRCNSKCQREECWKSCPLGFLKDVDGCKTCACVLPPTTDEDIVFVNEDDHIEERESVTFLSVDRGREDDLLPLPLPRFLPEEDLHLLIDADEDQQQWLTHRNDLHYHGRDSSHDHLETEEEPCNTTKSTEDNDLDPGREPFSDTPLRENIHKAILQAGDGLFLPMGYEDSSSHRKEEMKVKDRLENRDEFSDEATVISVVKADHSQLIMILVPMGVLFTLAILLLTHFWRRYHRDKYDINSYRPEEKEILHPVKTLQEDQTSLKHV